MKFNNIKKIALIHYSSDEVPSHFIESKLNNYNIKKNSITELDLKQGKSDTHWRVKLAEFLESLNCDYDMNRVSFEETSKLKKDIHCVVKNLMNDSSTNKWYIKIENKRPNLNLIKSKEEYLELINRDCYKDEIIFKSQLFKNSIFSCSIKHVDTSRPYIIKNVCTNPNAQSTTPFDYKEEIVYLDENNIDYTVLLNKDINLYE